MENQREEFIKRFKSTFIYDLLSETLTDEQLFEHMINTNGDIIWFKDQTRQMWFMWQHAQKLATPEGYVVVPMCRTCNGYGEVGCQFEGTFTCPDCKGARLNLKAMIEAVEKNDE